MEKRLSLGQYLPGTSWIHRLDPRVKFILLIVYFVAIFNLSSIPSYLIFILGLLAIFAMTHLPIVNFLKGLKPIIFLIVITFIINLLTIPGRVIWHWGIISISQEGVYRASYMALRIVLLVSATSLLTLTTSPKELTQALKKLFSPLEVFHFPAEELALMVSIALGFIPVLYDEADKIRRAQLARGADFESGNIFNRARAVVPLLVPLFVNSMDRAEDLAAAMEARCYRQGEGRTELVPLKMEAGDYLVLALGSGLLIVCAIFL